MTGLECLRAELLKRGFTKAQAESKAVLGVLEIVSGADGKYTELDKIQRDIATARETLSGYQDRIAEERAKQEWLRANNEANMAKINSTIAGLIQETQERIDAAMKALAECETAEGRDAIRAAQTFVNSVDKKTVYDNTAFIIGLAAILSRGSIGAIETLRKINPKIPQMHFEIGGAFGRYSLLSRAGGANYDESDS